MPLPHAALYTHSPLSTLIPQVGIAVYNVPLGVEDVPILCMLSMYLLLGIGTDGIFVFVNSLARSYEEHREEIDLKSEQMERSSLSSRSSFGDPVDRVSTFLAATRESDLRLSARSSLGSQDAFERASSRKSIARDSARSSTGRASGWDPRLSQARGGVSTKGLQISSARSLLYFSSLRLKVS